MYHYNFSGHPVLGFDFAPFVGTNFPTDGTSLTKLFAETLLAIPERQAILAGAPAEVILPGLSQAAAIFLAEWHGQFGNWPSIRWAIRQEHGFVYPDEASANLNDIRDAARAAR